MTDRLPTLPERRIVKDALRNLGLSDRQARALLSRGWSALVGESKSENDELRDQLLELEQNLKTGSM